MDSRRKRLLFRARHMGTNENDLFFGGFANRYLECMTDAQLDCLEELLNVDDPDLFQWITGAKPVPPQFDTDLMRMLKTYTVTDGSN